MPEELALQQRFRQGRAIDPDERPGAAAGILVQGLGHQLLAGARLAGDEHRSLGVGDPADELVHRLHGGAAADDTLAAVGKDGGAQVAGHAPLVQGPPQRGANGFGFQRLHQVVEGAGLHGPDRPG